MGIKFSQFKMGVVENYPQTASKKISHFGNCKVKTIHFWRNSWKLSTHQ